MAGVGVDQDSGLCNVQVLPTGCLMYTVKESLGWGYGENITGECEC